MVSGWYGDDWYDEPFEYDTHGKPCALVVERSVVAFPEELTKRFPDAKPAIEMGLESYLAVCLRAADGTHLGHLAVMDAGPMAAADDDVAAMRIFASRTAAEPERPDELALAAYFIVSEALTNARKYAHAQTIHVRVATAADALLVEIADDGRGAADPASGTGLRGLADRTDALRGRLDIDSPPGAGTRISAHLPLRPRG